MISFEDFDMSSSWAFLLGLSGPLFAATRPYNPAKNEYEVTGPNPDRRLTTPELSLQNQVVVGKETAYKALVGQFALRNSLILDDDKRKNDQTGSKSDTYLESFYTEQSGFKPRSFDSWGYRKWLHAAFVHADLPDEMLMATTSWHRDRPDVHFTQVKKSDGVWKPVERTRDFERLVDESYIQWAKDDLVDERSTGLALK
jgi:hypothetical protein